MNTPAVRELREGAAPIDKLRLERWFEANIPGCGKLTEIRRFAGGQSNPTYLVVTPAKRYVLRSQPSGKLLPSAHAVDREFRVMQALSGSEIPVAHAYAYCADSQVIGSAFYIMDYVPGRVFWNATLPETAPDKRTAIHLEMVRVISALHSVDSDAVGLQDFGRSSGYVERQVARWTRQYRSSQTQAIEAFEKLSDWLPRHVPHDNEAAIVHGDYRLDNVIFHPSEPRILAVLDWELSTIGHPLADFAYYCMRYHLPTEMGGLTNVDLEANQIPSEAQCVAEYCRLRRIELISSRDRAYYLAFSMFRLAAILQGVRSRALQGSASNARALEVGGRARPLAELAWHVAQQALDA